MSVPYDTGAGSYETNYYYGDPPYNYWHPYYPYKPHRIGWICPKCNSSYNPDVQKCWTCGTNNAKVTWNQPIYTATATNTAGDVEAEVGS